MCGISGVYAPFITDHDRQIIDAIMQSQTSRGPDHQGSLLIQGKYSEILLAHNRLSIIDLSNHAHQPLWESTGRYCIVYNGEIYNYIELRKELEYAGLIFKTESDTEVILNAYAYWGIDALQRFRGPFAFALFDKQVEQLWLCRDRFGIRPLYYAKINHSLYFASTAQQLAKSLNLKANISYVAKGLKYLVYEDDSDLAPYHGIYSLPSGSYMSVKLNSNQVISNPIHRYYNLANNVQSLTETLPLHSAENLLQLLIDKLENAVQIRLRTDVPLAISLSGGLDSSSIASLVSKQQANVIGFSFGHPLDKKSEGPLVACCAKFLNLQIEYVSPTPHEMIEALHKTIAIQDGPFTTMSIVAQYLLYQHVRRCGIKVLLGGQGGDEAFMGYKKFFLFWLQKLLKEKRYFSFAKNIWHLLPMLVSEISSVKIYWQHRHRYFNKTRESEQGLQLPIPSLELQNSKNIKIRQLQDITTFSLPTLLRYEDRNALGNSVESRLPYMDHQVIELGLALPEALKLRSGYGKWIIREMMKNQIPDQIRLARYKRGFDIPLVTLLKNGLGQSIRSILKINQSLIHDFLPSSSKNIDTLFSDQRFLQRQQTMREAITLLWLNKALS